MLSSHIRGTHQKLTFDIIKTEWMILETVSAEMPSSRAITLTLTRRSYKIMSTFWHISFVDASTGRPERESSSMDSLPPLKLLGAKLYLVVGR